MDDRYVYRLWRALLFGRLNRSSAAALSVYDDARELYEQKLSAAMLLSAAEGRKLLGYGISEAERIADICRREGISVVFRGDAAYPRQFGSLEDPPELIYVKGDAGVLGLPSCAIVGARQAEDYTLTLTGMLARELAANGISVVSGAAIGVDTAAHNGALAAEGVTVAVLGCGLLTDYPKGALRLRERIAVRGAVITEYPPLDPPVPANFLHRNRLIAALAGCVLCTQASERSGSLSTANLALSSGKRVYVTPPRDILSGAYSGIVSLLRDGAVQIYSAGDIIRGSF